MNHFHLQTPYRKTNITGSGNYYFHKISINFLHHINHFINNQYVFVRSAILNVYFIGFAAGSLLTVPIADKIGRKCISIVDLF